MEAFPQARRRPTVVHPGIHLRGYEAFSGQREIQTFMGKRVLLSLNRFERKKNIALAIETLLWLQRNADGRDYGLVVAGKPASPTSG
jgi:alpha-1,3/alpha-1,6-mannosyltransferase